jgi:hypothetical protein
VNPELLALLASKNASDIEAIIASVGIVKCIALLPHIVNIVNTVQQGGKPNAQAATPSTISVAAPRTDASR